MKASYHGCVEVVKLFIEKGAEVHRTDREEERRLL